MNVLNTPLHTKPSVQYQTLVNIIDALGEPLGLGVHLERDKAAAIVAAVNQQAAQQAALERVKAETYTEDDLADAVLRIRRIATAALAASATPESQP